MREVLNAIFYLNRSGCQWDMLPHDLPTRSTVHDYSYQWRYDGTWQEIMDAFVGGAHGRRQGAEPQRREHRQPDGQGDRAADDRGYDGGQKITGRKRHSSWIPWACSWSSWSRWPRPMTGRSPRGVGPPDGGAPSRLELLWADAKYHNHRLEGWLVETAAGYRIEVVSRPPDSRGM